MLVLFETPAGFALFKVLDEGKLNKVEVFMIKLCARVFCLFSGKSGGMYVQCRILKVKSCDWCSNNGECSLRK